MAETKGTMTFDVIVKRVRAHHNRYVYDDKQRGIRLQEVVYQRERLPADWGVILRTSDEGNVPLEALVLVAQPTFDGCIINCRPIGAIEVRHSGLTSYKIVAVPTVDPYFSDVVNFASLPRERIQEIEAFFRQSEAGESVEIVWHDVWRAEKMVSDALRVARLKDASARGAAAPPSAWQISLSEVTASPLVEDAWARETEACTAAERSLRKLPYRFQSYIQDCLLPDERVLLWVYRPSMTAASGGWRFLSRKQLNDGFLLVTDQQVALLVDALPPDASMVHWGYVARCSALERLCYVEMVHLGDRVRLTLGFRASGGVEPFIIDFPTEMAKYVEESAKVLQRFVPVVGDTRLQRLPGDIVTEGFDNEEREDVLPEEFIAQLHSTLSGDEEVLAMAFVPASTSRDRRAILIALTCNDVVLVREFDRTTRAMKYPIGEISSVELRKCLTGCSFGLTLPGGDGVKRARVEFESPVSAQFVKVLRIVRQLLANPVAQTSRAGVNA